MLAKQATRAKGEGGKGQGKKPSRSFFSFPPSPFPHLPLFLPLPAEAFAVAPLPGVAAHVVAAFFPESGLVFGEEADGLDPLRRLPRVELRDDEADGAAVLGRDRLAIVRPREERVFGEEVFER